MLFGVDVRSLGQQWAGAWQDLLFSYQSPLRRRLDEPVLLRGDDGREQWFQGGHASPEHAHGALQGSAPLALELPDAQVLSRTITIPIFAEAELASVLDLEVAATSPFPGDDTVFGWAEVSRDAQSVVLVLAMASRAGVSDWLRSAGQEVLPEGPGDDDRPMQPARLPPSPEVWADIDGTKVCIRGFGENLRERVYRRRLLRVATLAGGALLLLLLAAALFVLQQRVALGKLESLQAELQRDASEVSTLREALVSANEAIRSSNEIVAQHPNPHLELARLTEMLGDDAFLMHFSMRGHELRIRGRATGAATVMQTLARVEPYAAVTAPQPITAFGDTGYEQFHLDIDLAAAAGADSP
jgi:general secretion pathway protein L